LRIISLAFFLEGSISETPHRRTQIPEGVVPGPEAFGKRVLKNFSPKVERLLLRWRNRDVAKFRQNCTEPL
jgi:hypothetical protein